jgi:hypothetical protein
MALTKVIGAGLGNLDENITFSTAGKGVHLGVTSATASNLIHDYEEGSWTPSWSASGGGSGTYNYQVGRYTKIGNRVCINGYLSLTNKNTLSGTLSMAGLPFTSSNISQGYYSVAIWCNSMTNGGSADGDFFLEAFIDHNEANSIFMYTLDGDGGVAGITDSMLTNTSDFMVNCMYQTDL